MSAGRPFGGESSPVLDEAVRLAVHTVLVVAVYLLFAGHNAPGGGFSGGLVAGAAIFVRYVAGGRESARLTGVRFEVMLGAGLLLSILTGVGSLAAGDAFLEAWVFEEELPVLGIVKFTATLPFDIGVFLVVVGLVAAIVDSLGREADEVEPPAVEPPATGSPAAGSSTAEPPATGSAAAEPPAAESPS